MSSVVSNTYLNDRRLERLEACARELQIEVWRKARKCGREQSIADLLEPAVALNHLGYSVVSEPTLGEFFDEGRRSEVAGRIDRTHRIVSISMRFDETKRRWTTAHELGHAVMQPYGSAIHRDRPLDGPLPWRPPAELEADRFASAYLMPRKHLAESFCEMFGGAPFCLNEETDFALFGSRANGKRRLLKTPRDLSMHLASSISFGGRHFRALHSQYQVSRTAMAIRLEELGLVG